MRYLVVIIFLIIAYYALRDPRKGSSSTSETRSNESQKASNDSFETSFDEGLPSDYIPSDKVYYSDLQKLRDDYEYRATKLQRHFEEEKKELKNSPDFSPEKMDELIQKQNSAKEEFQKKFQIKRAEFTKRLEEEKSSRDKGLR